MILTAATIEALTNRKRRAAQVRQLQAMGIPFRLRTDGSPVVLEADLVASPAKTVKEPRLRLP